MRPLLPHLWPGTCLLVAVATCGCQHCRPCCSTCATPAAATTGVPVAARPASAPAAAAPIKHVATYPKFPPVVSTTDKPALPPATDSQLGLVPTSGPSATNVATEMERMSPASDATFPAGARYGHDANYHCLIGTLDYSRIQKAWILRYVPLEEEDRYGGCVTLVVPGRAIDFQRGQIVRVEGSLIDPDSQQLRPAFQVRNIRVEGP